MTVLITPEIDQATKRTVKFARQLVPAQVRSRPRLDDFARRAAAHENCRRHSSAVARCIRRAAGWAGGAVAERAGKQQPRATLLRTGCEPFVLTGCPFKLWRANFLTSSPIILALLNFAARGLLCSGEDSGKS